MLVIAVIVMNIILVIFAVLCLLEYTLIARHRGHQAMRRSRVERKKKKKHYDRCKPRSLLLHLLYLLLF